MYLTLFCACVNITQAQNIIITQSIGNYQFSTGDIVGKGITIGIEKKINKSIATGLNLETFSASKEYEVIDSQGNFIPIFRIGTRYAGVNPYLSFTTPKVFRFQLLLDIGAFVFKTNHATPEIFEIGIIQSNSDLNNLLTYTTFKTSNSKKPISLGIKSHFGLNFFLTKKIVSSIKFGLFVDNFNEIIINSKIGIGYAI